MKEGLKMSKENLENQENQEVLVRKFRIKVGSATNKQSGEKFPTFKVVKADGHFMKLKFRKVVKEVPANDCYIYVKDGNFSIDKNTQYPVLWVHEIERTEALNQPNVAEEKSKATYEEYFA